MTFIAVVTSVYNQAHYLPESVASVEAQTRLPDNYVIVDDGSDDRPTLPSDVVTARHRVNRGHAAALNTAIALTNAQWILKVDADDTIAPTYIEEIELVSEAYPDRNVIFSPCQMFGDKQEVYRYPDFNPAAMIDVFMIPGPAAFRRDLWWRVGGFDESMRYGEDWDFWIRAERLVGLKPCQLNVPLWNYRMHDGPRVSTEGIRDVERLKRYWRGHTRETVAARSRTWALFLEGKC